MNEMEGYCIVGRNTFETPGSPGKFGMCGGKRKLNPSIDADEDDRIITKLLVQGLSLLLYQIFLYFFSKHCCICPL